MSRNKSEKKKVICKATGFAPPMLPDQPITWDSLSKMGIKVSDMDPDQALIMTAGELLDLLRNEFDAGQAYICRQF